MDFLIFWVFWVFWVFLFFFIFFWFWEPLGEWNHKNRLKMRGVGLRAAEPAIFCCNNNFIIMVI
ncbi:hypothetical protein THIOM_004583 [Candidatus Thiomargarita nelsonii]|uniref:Uncharacterized protein n=1 Tax=Candidatus Thiomargarita nelsonii TaxID=1003181 RepID=A0A176RVK0_9GAMM|nr:hypothetical protein THIOM_004583 [Candidatus Thiomargarita nelsonii]